MAFETRDPFLIRQVFYCLRCHHCCLLVRVASCKYLNVKMETGA